MGPISQPIGCVMSLASAHVDDVQFKAAQPAANSDLIWSHWRMSKNGRASAWAVDVDHRRVGRLMRQNGISVVRTRKHKVTTDSDHKFNIAPNLMDRDFMADAPNQKWAGDISYVWTRAGWLYLAVIIDLHSRRVIGWAVSNRMKRDLAIRAPKMAIAFRSPPQDCIHHADRGSQCCSHDIRRSCASTGSACRRAARAIAATTPPSKPPSNPSRQS